MSSTEKKLQDAVGAAARQVESVAGEYFDVEKGYERFAEEGSHYLQELTNYVKKNPTAALFGAVAIGAIAAYLMYGRDDD